jgi:tetratricopeptide (TPR) repeat protein
MNLGSLILQQLKLPFIFLTILVFSGCSTTTKIKYLEPAKVAEVSKLKHISIEDFKNDTVGLTGKIESRMSQTRFNNKPYFTLVSRDKINEIITEQKRQYSGITNDKKSVQLGEIVATRAFITGKVHSKDFNDTTFYEGRTKCLDEKCKKTQTYRVRCKKRHINLGANIKIINVETSKLVYTNTYNKSGSWSACTDSYGSLPSPSKVWEKQANLIASQFINAITPSYTYREIELLEKPDIDYSSSQKSLLESGLAFIEKNRMEKADRFLSQLVFETQSKSYVANYNLGVVKESQGEYQKAKQLFTLADNLLKKPNDIISDALERINRVIEKHQKAQQQLKDN